MTGMTGHELFARIQAGLGPEARRHRGVDPPGRRDQAIAGGSYRAIGALVDGFRAGDADVPVTGVVVAARASTAVLEQAVALGANIVISRSAFLGDSQDRPVAQPEPALAAKLDYIAEHGLAVLRLQDPRTGPAGLAVTTAFPRALGLEAPQDGRRYRGGAGLSRLIAPRDRHGQAHQGRAADADRAAGRRSGARSPGGSPSRRRPTGRMRSRR